LKVGVSTTNCPTFGPGLPDHAIRCPVGPTPRTVSATWRATAGPVQDLREALRCMPKGL
jgi:hypothetical protein